MKFEREINMLTRAFEKCHVPVFMVARGASIKDAAEAPGTGSAIPEAIASILDKIIEEARDNTLYAITDAAGCRYRLMKVPEEEACLFAGPYITDLATREEILENAEVLGLDAHQAKLLEKYYEGQTVIAQDSRLFVLLEVLADVMWGPENYDYENLEPGALGEAGAMAVARALEEVDPIWDMKSMERRYAYENRMMEAVSNGQYYKIESIIGSIGSLTLEERMADTLRNSKNYMIIMNTLLRKAAEKGGVHPLYLDKISSDYAYKIEALGAAADSSRMMVKMLKDYCKLVSKHATRNYSTIVRTVILYINGDLTADLSLKALAQVAGVSGSHLSTTFKKETGQTLTAYVTDRRIAVAKDLLRGTRLQIQTVAQHCGFVDLQYFSKVFKKHTGRTPSEYRESKLRGEV